MKYPITIRITIPSINQGHQETILTKTWEKITNSPFWFKEFLGEAHVTTFPVYPHTNDFSNIVINETWSFDFKSRSTSVSKKGVYILADIETITRNDKRVYLGTDDNREKLIDTLVSHGWEYSK